MGEGRGRLSFWDTLPDWADEVRVWAVEALATREKTQLEILEEVNNRLRVAAAQQGIMKDVPQASRSSLNRLAMRRAAAIKRMQEARAMFDGLASQFDAKSADESAIVLGEYLKTLILEIADMPFAQEPKAAMELARAYQSVVSGMRISSDRRQKLEKEFAEKTAKAVEKAAEAAGLSADTVEAIKAKILGVKANA